MTTIAKKTATFLSIFTVFTAFSLATQVRPSYAVSDLTDMSCQSSQRGIRCNANPSGEKAVFTASQIDGLISLIEEVCSTSSRGQRCTNKSENMAIMIDPEQSFKPEETSCNQSVRGTRCGASLL